jgi:hypothetical protein
LASTRSGQENAERAEMMLADPGRVQPDLLGINRFVENIGDKGVRVPAVVVVVIVAQREIAEFHLLLSAAKASRVRKRLLHSCSRYNHY